MPKLESALYLASLILQVMAVVFALRMVRRSALRAPWYLMATAMSAMALYRMIRTVSPVVALTPTVEDRFRLFAAVVALVVSLLLFLSLFAIRQLCLVHECAETARRAAEESLRQSDLRLRAIFGQTDNFLAVLRTDGTLVDINPAPLAAAGHQRADVIGKRFWDTPFYDPSPDVQAQLRDGVAQAAAGVTVRQESSYFTKDGLTRTVDRSIAPMRDPSGQVAYVIVEARDISDRKLAEAELVRAKREAESASAAKDQFLAVLSHELRTPLTPVLLMVSMLEKQTDLPATVRDEVGMIRRNIEMEARLIDDLLDLTRITRGKLPLNVETADLHLLITSAVAICNAGATDGAGPAMTLRLNAKRHTLRGDPARLQQVIWNLLNNARKFTPAAGRIDVTTSDVGDGHARIEVTDTGKGIEPDLLPKVFHAFEQGSATARRFGGLGLGLAICKALVELHDGSIEAFSDGPDRGARFVVEVPVLALAAPAPAETGSGVFRASALRILLVEDHEDTAKMMRKLLSGMGHDVRAAGTARDAELAFQAEPFDLVISDLGLPDATGHELIVRLKEHRPVRGIAVSGYGMAEDVRKSTDAGFIAHVTKPLDLKRLKAAITAACGPGDATVEK